MLPNVVLAALAVASILIAPARAQELPTEIGVRNTPAGDFLTDAKGLTLYTFEADAQSRSSSACIDKCALQWPPLLAPADATPRGAWSLAKRPDGQLQWRHNGRPLYTFAKDDRPLAQYGVGRSKLWRIAFDPLPTPPGIGVRATLRGFVLVDDRGHTLYARTGETITGRRQCEGDCLDQWPPLRAPAMAVGFDDWTVVARREGFLQWAFKGRPLYTFAGDEVSGATLGEGVDKTWGAMTIGPAPGVPNFVTMQNSDFGRILADADGKTLYAFTADPEKVRRESCNEACFAEYWRPLAASPEAEIVDQWSIVTHPDGSRQWAFRGDPVYTHTKDARIGDVGGFRFATGNSANGASFLHLVQTVLFEAAD